MRKKNHLYTVNRWNRPLFLKESLGLLGQLGLLGHLFANGSTLNTPISLPSGSPSSWLSSNGQGVMGQTMNAQNSNALSTNVKGWLGLLSLLGGTGMSFGADIIEQVLAAGLAIGSLIDGGKSSTVGNLFKGLGAPITGGLINAAFGSKMNNENISRFQKENALLASMTVDDSSDAAVINAFLNYQNLGEISRKDVGSDGWLSDKAKNKTKELNLQRKMANAHAMSALELSVVDLDTNKDNTILTNYAANGGKIRKKLVKLSFPNIFADGGYGLNWLLMVFGNVANLNTGGSTSWGGSNNMMAYALAAASMANTAMHWKDEDYNRATLGSGMGMLGQGFSILNSSLLKSSALRKKDVANKIGLAEGGKLKKNVFANGGDYALAAASALKIYNNALTLAQAPDISDYTNKLNNNSNWDYSGIKSNDALMSNWKNNYKTYNSNITGQDLRGKTWGQDLLDSNAAAMEGVLAGSAFGPIGAVVGGIIGGGSSLIGSVIGRHKAKQQAEQLRKNILAANNRQINSVIYQGNSIDRANDIQAKALDYALGGGLNIGNMGALEYSYLNSFPTVGNAGGVGNVLKAGTFFDEGGMMDGFLLSHGANWESRVRNMNTGGSHEENPNDGIQVGVDEKGTPNLVEEGEVIWNDYVFSNRIEAPKEVKQMFGIRGKQLLTFADVAKKLEDEGKERPNDPISKAGIDDNMSTLAEAQEEIKKQRDAERARAEFEALSPEELVAVILLLLLQLLLELVELLMVALQELAALEQAMAELLAAELGLQVVLGLLGRLELLGELIMAEGGNLYATGSQLEPYEEPYAAMRNYDIKNGGIHGVPIGGRDYSTWKTFTYGDNIPLWIEEKDDYLPEYGGASVLATNYENNAFYKWLRSKEGEKFRNEWWTKENAPNFYKSNPNGPIPTWDELLGKAGGKDKGLMFDRNYGDAHAFGAAAFDKFMNAQKKPKEKAKHTPQTYHTVIGPDGVAGEDFLPSNEKDWVGVGKEVRRMITPEGDTIIYHEVADGSSKDATGKKKKVPNYEKGEWLLYAGLAGPAIGLGLWAAGVGKPNTSGLDAAVSASRVAPIMAKYRPIGDYLRFNPMDINYERNKALAQSRANARAIQNNAGTRGAAMAGLLANEYNSMLANGLLYRNALEYNDAQKQQVALFNRGTNQFNAQAFNQAALQYANDYNNQKRFNAQLAYLAAAAKMDADAGWYNSLYGNIGQLAAGLGRIGEKKANHNWMADMYAQDMFGAASPEGSHTGKYVKYAAKGGKLKRRKKGFTF